MTTDEKLVLIVDKLLVKTQDGLCNWKKYGGGKFRLGTIIADIQIYTDYPCNHTYNIVMTIWCDNMVIASISADHKEREDTLVRLFEHVKAYHEKYVNERMDDVMKEINKLGEDKPF